MQAGRAVTWAQDIVGYGRRRARTSGLTGQNTLSVKDDDISNPATLGPRKFIALAEMSEAEPSLTVNVRGDGATAEGSCCMGSEYCI